VVPTRIGKLMSLSDALMWRYYELLSDRDLAEIEKDRCRVKTGELHPMEAKKSLAEELVTRFHGGAAAQSARDYFETRHQKRSTPGHIQKRFAAPEPIWICRLLVDLDFAKSGSEARRLIAQGAVRVDGQTIADVNFHFQGDQHEVLEVGKNRIAQVAK
jgi:tyrosyl-tRNA synthetase